MLIRTLTRTLMIIALLGCAQYARADTLTFTAIPDEDESRLQQRFGKVADYLSRSLGLDVVYIPVKSYGAAISAFRNNQVQLAWFGGLSGVRARQLVPGSEAIAQGQEDQFFKTLFIAHHSTAIEPTESFPESIRGKTFTFGAKGSTSGRLMPEYYIRQHLKQAPEAAFRRVGFSGDHSRTIALVQAGAWQVGAVNYKVWENALQEGTVDPSKVRVIWTTPVYPDYHWTVRGDADARFGEGFTARLQQSLLSLDDPELLASFPRQAFVPASNSDYEPVAQIAREIGLLD